MGWFSSPPIAPPKGAENRCFLLRRQKEKTLISFGNQGFATFCFSSKWYHQESNRGHKDFQSFALPTELWHHPDQRSVPYYRGAKVSKFFQPANISRFFSEIILLTQICTSAKTPANPWIRTKSCCKIFGRAHCQTFHPTVSVPIRIRKRPSTKRNFFGPVYRIATHKTHCRTMKRHVIIHNQNTEIQKRA